MVKHYIIVFFLFLLEITTAPAYVNTIIKPEFLIIAYFLYTIKLQKNINHTLITLLLVCVSFINQEVFALTALAFFTTQCVYKFHTRAKARNQYIAVRKKIPNSSAIFAFSVLFLLFTLIRIIGHILLGYNVSITQELLYYFFNVFLFFITLLCLGFA